MGIGLAWKKLMMIDHLPTTCCCRTFTPACPIDCLQTIMSKAAFNPLARADGAPFDPRTTVGQVVELLRQGRLGQAAWLGPRRLGETEAGLVLAELAISNGTPR